MVMQLLLILMLLIDKIVIKTETLPAGFAKSSLLNASGVDVTTGIDSYKN